MAEGAHVQELAVLARFRSALERFRGSAQDAVGLAQREASEAREWVDGQLQKAGQEVDYWQHRLRSLLDELSDVDDSDDEDADLQDAIDDARWQLREASQQLERVRLWARRLQQENERLSTCATRLNHLSFETISRAQALLERKLDLLELYVAHPIAAERVEGGASPVSATQSHGYPESLAKRGFRDVPVDLIDTSDSPVKSPDDFRKGTSYPIIAKECRDLNDIVRPAVKRGAGPDHFRDLDMSRRSHTNTRLQDVYTWFFGQRPVRLVYQNGRYTVENGYHRIFVATRLGLRTIPAVVVER